jgi:rRNA maturation protein Nop10
MTDVKCPYCGGEQDINHDDGYGLTEEDEHEQECGWCEKTFIFFTTFSLSYEVQCQPDDHVLEPPDPDRHPHLYKCNKCGYYTSKKPNEEGQP